MCAEGDVSIFIARGKVWIEPFVERCNTRFVEIVVSYTIEEIDKPGVRLAVDMFQLNSEQLSLTETVTGKEVGGIIIWLQKTPLGIFNNRGRVY